MKALRLHVSCMPQTARHLGLVPFEPELSRGHGRSRAPLAVVRSAHRSRARARGRLSPHLTKKGAMPELAPTMTPTEALIIVASMNLLEKLAKQALVAEPTLSTDAGRFVEACEHASTSIFRVLNVAQSYAGCEVARTAIREHLDRAFGPAAVTFGPAAVADTPATLAAVADDESGGNR